jgi:transmembrane sensor
VNATAPDGEIETQAREWALAVFGERLPADRAQSFRAWLDADPRHAAAYASAEQLMLSLRDVPALAQPQRQPARRAWIWAALPLAACAAIGIGVSNRATVLESDRAVRTVALRDGSTAILSPGTRLREAGWLSGRRYDLERGEALFDVQHAEGRPFEVRAGEAQVTVLGTRFDVRKGASGEIGVAVERGRVAVRRATFETVLARGDALTLDASGVRRVRLSDPEAAADWRHGQLSYTSAPMRDVADDINRFSDLKVAVDPAVADLRLTASFRADQAQAFLDSLPALLPLEVRTQPDGVRLIAPRTR